MASFKERISAFFNPVPQPVNDFSGLLESIRDLNESLKENTHTKGLQLPIPVIEQPIQTGIAADGDGLKLNGGIQETAKPDYPLEFQVVGKWNINDINEYAQSCSNVQVAQNVDGQINATILILKELKKLNAYISTLICMLGARNPEIETHTV